MKVNELLFELGKTTQYKKPIGMMEMYKFMQIATPEQKVELKQLIANGKQREAWKLLQTVTGTKL